MGLFDFVMGAGERLFGKNDDPQQAAKADPATPQFDPAFVASQLTRKVERLGLPIEGLEVDFQDGVATIRGEVPSSEVAEKAVLQLGNTSIVESVDDQLVVTAPPEPPAVFHTVAKGDTLSKIAVQYYGTWKRYPEIFEANKPMLTDPDLIYPGQVLRIPGAEASQV
ncbi:MAG: peptidoglycan-binding protein LysM [Alphaproteobacteria bacterium]|nr:peptidoglycan-binding protein LysM [Alphaproteobacteria bacterium]